MAAALRQLELRVTWVGNDDAPGRGSPDSDILEHAANNNQVVVTSNHDMIVLAAECGASIVWVDPRGRQLSRSDTVLRVFGQYEEWAEQLNFADGPVCVHSLKSKVSRMPLEAASNRALRRMREIKRRKKRRLREIAAGSELPFPEEDEEA